LAPLRENIVFGVSSIFVLAKWHNNEQLPEYILEFTGFHPERVCYARLYDAHAIAFASSVQTGGRRHQHPKFPPPDCRRNQSFTFKNHCMCVSVITAAGNLAGNRAAFQPLIQFIRTRKTGVILVISPLDEIYSLVISQLDSLSHGAIEATDHGSRLSDIWRNTTGISPNGTYVAHANRLSGLLKGISLTGDCSETLKEDILAFCGHLSALIFSEKLRIQGVGNSIRVPDLLGTKVPDRIKMDGYPENATAGAAGPNPGETWIVADHYRISAKGEIRGRNASTVHTAALIAEKFEAPELTLWSDEIQFHTAPPDLVSRSREISRLTFQEAGALSGFMNDAIHPCTLELLEARQIPVHIYNPGQSGLKPATIIDAGRDIPKDEVRAVACTDDISLLEVNGPGVGSDPGILFVITRMLSGLDISTKLLSVSRNSIRIIMDLNSGRLAETAARETESLAKKDIIFHSNVSLLALVGQNGNAETAADFFQALAAAKIDPLMGGTGEPALAGFAVIGSDHAQTVVKAVHRAFFKIWDHQHASILNIINQN
jgi:aspartate kinase/aspartokinase/homoserine dehydrogenase 1